MQQFIDWLVVNWQFVSSAAISVVSFILLLIFRIKKSVVFQDRDYNFLCNLIKTAEEKYGAGKGSAKMEFVLNTFFGADDFAKSVAGNEIKRRIETILSCPQKKGD